MERGATLRRIASSLQKGGYRLVVPNVDQAMSSQKRSDSIDPDLDTEMLACKRGDVVEAAPSMLEDELGHGTRMDRLKCRSTMSSSVAMGRLHDLLDRGCLRRLDGSRGATNHGSDGAFGEVNTTVREEEHDEANEQSVMAREFEEV